MGTENTDELTVFDRTEAYKKNVEPLVKKIKNECSVLHIPFFFSACVKNSEEGSVYKNESHPCGSGGYKLKDDRITPHLGITLGFRAVPKTSMEEIMMDEIESEDSAF